MSTTPMDIREITKFLCKASGNNEAVLLTALYVQEASQLLKTSSFSSSELDLEECNLDIEKTAKDFIESITEDNKYKRQAALSTFQFFASELAPKKPILGRIGVYLNQKINSALRC